MNNPQKLNKEKGSCLPHFLKNWQFVEIFESHAAPSRWNKLFCANLSSWVMISESFHYSNMYKMYPTLSDHNFYNFKIHITVFIIFKYYLTICYFKFCRYKGHLVEVRGHLSFRTQYLRCFKWNIFPHIWLYMYMSDIWHLTRHSSSSGENRGSSYLLPLTVPKIFLNVKRDSLLLIPARESARA